MANKCCAKEPTCFSRVAKRTIKFGPNKRILNGGQRITTRDKLVRFGVERQVLCGKNTNKGKCKCPQ